MDSPVFIPEWPRDWPCQKWTFQSLAELLKDKKFSCRVWKKSNAHVFETNCEHVNVTLSNFCDWLGERATQDNPLHCYGRKEYNCYIDYKYMKDMFESVSEVLEDVKWCDFGLLSLDGYDSTIWIGSEGASTPCHQDSYGFNVVTQIQGRKLWVLFPPSDSSCLYATRIPYEESSVFSEVDIRNPDFNEHPQFQFSHPVIVILSPGQSLYVPHLWWHYVESLEPSISINVWVAMEEDKHQHLSEAITRCLATSLITNSDPSENCPLQNQLVNPTEELYPSKMNYTYLRTALDALDSSCRNEESSEETVHGLGNPDKSHAEKGEDLAEKSKAGVNHLKEFQQWISQSELSDFTNLSSPSNERVSSEASHCPKKVCTRASETQVSNESSLFHFDKEQAFHKDCGDGNVEQLKEERKKLNSLDTSSMKNTSDARDKWMPQKRKSSQEDSCDLLESSSSGSSLIGKSCSVQKRKVYPLSSIPFQDFQENLQNIFHSGSHHCENPGTFSEAKRVGQTSADTIHNKQTFTSEHCFSFHQTSTTTFDQLSDVPKPTISSTNLPSHPEKNQLNKVVENKNSLRDSELAQCFISTVLHPSVIDKISTLLKEKYKKEVKRKCISNVKT